MCEPGASERVAIIGGGTTGLYLADRLVHGGHQVTVFEAAPEIGGLAAAWQLPAPDGASVTWDRHYHVILRCDTELLRLVDHLGLTSDLRWGKTRTACVAGGELHDVTTPTQFLRLKALPPVARGRIGLSMAAAMATRDWKQLEQVPVGTWLRRWAGPTAYEKFWRPLLRAKLGDAVDETSAAFIWATVKRLGAARGTGFGDESFGYLHGGYHRLLTVFADHLREHGADIRTGTPTLDVRPETPTLDSRTGTPTLDVRPETPTLDSRTGPPTLDGVIVRTAAGEERFDRAILTCTTHAAAELLPTAPDTVRAEWTALRYQGVVCASVLVDRPITGAYITNITDPSDLTGVIEMTSLVDPAELGGHHLVYLPRYVAPDDPLFDATDDEISGRFLAALERIAPSFRRDHVHAVRISRVRRVFAVPTLGYSAIAPTTATGVANVHLVTGAQIVNGTLNVNEGLELAARALPALDPPLIPASLVPIVHT